MAPFCGGKDLGIQVPKKRKNKNITSDLFEFGQGIICAMVKSRYIGDGHPTFNGNPYNGYINPY